MTNNRTNKGPATRWNQNQCTHTMQNKNEWDTGAVQWHPGDPQVYPSTLRQRMHSHIHKTDSADTKRREMLLTGYREPATKLWRFPQD